MSQLLDSLADGTSSDAVPGTLTSSTVEQSLDRVTVVGHKQPQFKVKLICQNPDGDNDVVIFEASAPVSESRAAAYDGYGVVQLPTDLFAYKGTGARSFTITGMLVSRTLSEAATNAGYLNLIRSWILPDFGGSGAPPPVLKIYGYGSINLDGRQVSIKSYSWSFPNEVDFIFPPGDYGDTGEPMPVIGTVTIDLVEVYSAAQVTQGAWKIKMARSQSTNTATSAPGVTDSSVPSSAASIVSPTSAAAGAVSSAAGIANSTVNTAKASVQATLASATPDIAANVPGLLGANALTSVVPDSFKRAAAAPVASFITSPVSLLSPV
jgi:hypothetical protein